MKNLKLYSMVKTFVREPQIAQHCCILGDSLYLLCDSNIFAVEGTATRLLCNLEEYIKDDFAVYMGASIITNCLVICMSKGDILSVNIDNADIDVVGCMEPGISQAAWSPGMELCAVVTKNYSLVLLSQDLEALHEIELCQSGIEKQVSVGWGSKETQFRGSEGKIKSGDLVQNDLNGSDDGAVRIAWRGDGECLAVSYLTDNLRHLKVCSNDGALLYSSDAIPGLESALSWRPNGSILASSEKLPNKRMICFFEKNLLPHGGFQIDDGCIVKELFWNCDSTILAMLSKYPTPLIKLYTVANYHWYEKYTIKLDKNEELLLAEWDKFEAQTLHLVTTAAASVLHTRWSWRWNVDCSRGVGADDQATVAVIDGHNSMMTHFKKCVIPPPMSSSILKLTEPLSAIEFLQHEDENINSNNFIAQTGENSISFFTFDTEKSAYNLTFKAEVPEKVLFSTAWITRTCVLACSINQKGQHELVCLTVDSTKSLLIKTMPLQNPAVAIRYIHEKKVALLWDPQQNLTSVDLNSLTVIDNSSNGGPKSGKLLGIDIRSKMFVLDSAYRLTVDNDVIASNVTSFRVANGHLLVTTMQHKLLCWPLDNLSCTASERSVERGARIVTVVPGTSNVVLQLPRGNLEVVRPRALTIARLKQLINELKYGQAMGIMRVERVNLNLFFDHQPTSFLDNISTFISNITDTSYICTFVAELSAENVTQTLYSSFYEKCELHFSDKVSTICSAMLQALDRREDKVKFFLPILSCLIKKGNTDEALILVQKKLEAEKKGIKESVTSSDGLAHILYLVDVEQLFKIALGTYDLSLVMFIASKSQKDPKEYVPFLVNLQNMEENYQKFTIDNFLKRYKKALTHLALCPDKSKECLEYVSKHNLYRTALRLFAPNTDSWKAACVSYGGELTRTSHHEEAGLILQRAGEFLLAQHAFSRAGAWRKEIACAKLAGSSSDQMKLLYKSVADSLLTSGRYSEAARFYLDYAHDVKAAVGAFCDACNFSEALATTETHQQLDLILSMVKPSAASACSTYEQSIADSKESFERNLARLKEVQRVRVESGGVDWDDTASESSQGSSRASSRASSTRSAKNARKLERNLMKKGGPFEEIALIASLHDIVTQMAKLKSQVRSLNLALISLDEQVIASHLQVTLNNFLERLRSVIFEVWPKPIDSAAQHATSNSLAASFNTTARALPAPVHALQPKVLFAPDLGSGVEWRLETLFDE